MKNTGLKYWMMNIMIDSLTEKLDNVILKETQRFGKIGLKDNPDDVIRFNAHIEELKLNEMHEIGKTNITLNLMTKMRDDWSLSVTQDMCNHPHEKMIIEKDKPACGECKKKFTDWSCPSSPDKCCHYYSKIGDMGYYVTLIDGTKHYLEGYTHEKANDETEDDCIFCGEPDERK